MIHPDSTLPDTLVPYLSINFGYLDFIEEIIFQFVFLLLLLTFLYIIKIVHFIPACHCSNKKKDYSDNLCVNECYCGWMRSLNITYVISFQHPIGLCMIYHTYTWHKTPIECAAISAHQECRRANGIYTAVKMYSFYLIKQPKTKQKATIFQTLQHFCKV